MRIASLSGLVGSCLIAIGLLVNPWSVSHLLWDVVITLQGMLLIIAFEIFFIIGGVLVLFKGNTPTGRKHLAFGFIAVLLVVLVSEGFLHIVDAAIEDGPTDHAYNRPRYLSSAYEEQEWAETYFNQYWQLKSDYEPFIGWDRREYHSEYINIDSDGVRETWNAEHLNGEVSLVAVSLELSEDCLLYTSPSPRDRQKSRMPSSA